jgi:hypothetical protein
VTARPGEKRAEDVGHVGRPGQKRKVPRVVEQIKLGARNLPCELVGIFERSR